jgi:hypothetical protein
MGYEFKDIASGVASHKNRKILLNYLRYPVNL